MSLSTRLSKIKFRLTPRRVAVRYVEWLWDFPRTSEPNPLDHLLKEMEKDIRSRAPSANASEYYREAENYVFFLLDLYTSAITFWCDQVCTLMHLNQTAFACLRFPTCPELLTRIQNQYDLVWIHTVAVEMVQTDHLRASVLPPGFWIVEAVSLQASLAKIAVGSGTSVETRKILDSEELQAQARDYTRAFANLARRTACRGSCNRNAPLLVEAVKRVAQSLADSLLSKQIVNERLEKEVERPKAKHPGATASPKTRAKRG